MLWACKWGNAPPRAAAKQRPRTDAFSMVPINHRYQQRSSRSSARVDSSYVPILIILSTGGLRKGCAACFDGRVCLGCGLDACSARFELHTGPVRPLHACVRVCGRVGQLSTRVDSSHQAEEPPWLWLPHRLFPSHPPRSPPGSALCPWAWPCQDRAKSSCVGHESYRICIAGRKEDAAGHRRRGPAALCLPPCPRRRARPSRQFPGSTRSAT